MVRLKEGIAPLVGVTNKFQFLMVRLKVKQGQQLVVLPVLFQFLMVRLKEAIANLSMARNTVFQFLMVRLKGQHD